MKILIYEDFLSRTLISEQHAYIPVSSDNSMNPDVSSDKIIVEIPPWALPKEQITFYVKLQKGLLFSKILISLPDCMDVEGTINVDNMKSLENTLEILDIGRSKLSKYDYFGITISSKEPFDELAVQSKIPIKLIEPDNTETKLYTYARIFRPKLDLQQIPDSISLNDVEETSLPIHLKFKGFGDISIRIEANIGGDLVSEGGSSLMDRLFHGFLREGFFDEDLENADKKDFKINKIALTRALDVFKDKIRDVEYVKSLEQDKEINEDAIEWLKSFDESEQEKFMNVLYGTMEGYLVKKLTDMFSRNVSRHLQIDSGTNISAEIKAELTNLDLKIFYKDLNGNVYPPLETTLKIVDKREINHEIRVSIPIDIEKVDETEAYKNVGEMIIQNVS